MAGQVDLLDETARDWAVTGPTLLDDVPEHVYHAGGVRTPGPQVSQSGLKMLRPPSTPAEFQHYLLHGMKTTRAMERGSAAHTVVLGRGQDFVRHPDEEDGYLSATGAMNSTKKSKDWIAARRELGLIVLKGAEYEALHRQAEAILAHPRAGELFTDPQARAEVSAYYEAAPGLWMRSRFDLLRGSLVDLKTAADPHAEAWEAQAWRLGYHLQDMSYRRAYVACTGEPDPGPMEFVVVGSEPPYLVGVYDLSREFQQLAEQQLDAALAVYADQYARHGDPRAEGVVWDGLPLEKRTLNPPLWATRDLAAMEAAGVLDDLERILLS